LTDPVTPATLNSLSVKLDSLNGSRGKLMRVAVVGGGIAGSACAVALRRSGAEVTVHEAYPDPAGRVGSFVSLAANGLRAVAALGCLAEVQAAGFPVARQRMWSGRGKALGEVARARRPEDPLHSVTLWRADLVRILREAAQRAGATVATGQPAPERPDADLVVGADGIWSTTRERLDPDAPRPRYAGIYTVSGVSDAASVPAGTPTDGFNWIFARRGVLIHMPAPDGTTWWSAQVSDPTEPADPKAVGPDQLLEIFATEPAALDVLRASPRVRAATLMHVLAPVRTRHDDRTVLVGDAAHPAGSGQGASMALEDAVVLAQELAAAPGVPAALEAFDRTRQPRAGKLAKMESKNRDAKTAGPLAARLREIVMPHVFPRVYENATGWLYDFEPAELPRGATA
jgi:salicylate hydroxylase